MQKLLKNEILKYWIFEFTEIYTDTENCSNYTITTENYVAHWWMTTQKTQNNVFEFQQINKG